MVVELPQQHPLLPGDRLRLATDWIKNGVEPLYFADMVAESIQRHCENGTLYIQGDDTRITFPFNVHEKYSYSKTSFIYLIVLMIRIKQMCTHAYIFIQERQYRTKHEFWCILYQFINWMHSHSMYLSELHLCRRSDIEQFAIDVDFEMRFRFFNNDIIDDRIETVYNSVWYIDQQSPVWIHLKEYIISYNINFIYLKYNPTKAACINIMNEFTIITTRRDRVLLMFLLLFETKCQDNLPFRSPFDVPLSTSEQRITEFWKHEYFK